MVSLVSSRLCQQKAQFDFIVELKAVIFEIWKQIPTSTCKNLPKSLATCLFEGICFKGKQMKYYKLMYKSFTCIIWILFKLVPKFSHQIVLSGSKFLLIF